MEMKFFKCKKCGQIVAKVKVKGCPIFCCGEEMEEMVPNTTDAAQEKHVPVWEAKDGVVTVTVGSTEHPMLEEHYIEWIMLQTKAGNQRKALNPGDAPKATFYIAPDDEVIATFEYCNLHGFWKG